MIISDCSGKFVAWLRLTAGVRVRSERNNVLSLKHRMSEVSFQQNPARPGGLVGVIVDSRNLQEPTVCWTGLLSMCSTRL